MAYMIEFSEDKVENLSEKIGKALRYMGEAMTCLDEMQNGGSRSGERSPMHDYRDVYGERSYYGDRPEYMGERRGMRGSGYRY